MSKEKCFERCDNCLNAYRGIFSDEDIWCEYDEDGNYLGGGELVPHRACDVCSEFDSGEDYEVDRAWLAYLSPSRSDEENEE